MLTRQELAKVHGVLLAENLIYGPDMRKCAVDGCKEYTRYRTPRQPKHGTCIDHALPRPPELSWREVKHFISTHFPGGTFLDPKPEQDGEPVGMRVLRIYARDPQGLVPPFITTEYGYPPNAGPCQLCGTYIRRYGFGGRQFCRTCSGVVAA